MDIDVLMNNALVLVPIVLALTQVYKMLTGEKAHKWTPLVSIVVGILISWLFGTGNGEYKYFLQVGIFAGLSASGLFSGLKHTSLYDGEKEETH
jgi:hypothetical protein